MCPSYHTLETLLPSLPRSLSAGQRRAVVSRWTNPANLLCKAWVEAQLIRALEAIKHTKTELKNGRLFRDDRTFGSLLNQHLSSNARVNATTFVHEEH